MTIFSFIYLLGIYVLIILFDAFEGVGLENQLIYSSFFILFVGIPHGSIDHVLFLRKRKLSQVKFYSYYFGLIILFLLFWMVSTIGSFLFFLILSAFHFGESQFNDLNLKKVPKYLFYFFWGASILLNLIFYNLDELTSLTIYFRDTMDLNIVYNLSIITNLFYLINGVVILILAYFYFKKKMKRERLFSEFFLLFLIHITFFLFPFIIGFTLFFVVLHSLQVMYQEFIFFKKNEAKFTLADFIKLLLPYSLISIGFTILIIGLSYYEWINLSIPYLSLLIISVITLPHAIVMNIFYNE